MLHNGLQVDQSAHKQQLALVCSRIISSSRILNYKHMTLATGMLNYISPCILERKTYCLKCPNVLRKMS